MYIVIKWRLNANEENLKREQINRRGTNYSLDAFDMPMREDTLQGGIPTLDTPITGAPTTMSSDEKQLRLKKKELLRTKRFNQQLIAMMLCYLVSFLVSFALNFRHIIPDFNAKFYYFRQILRILNILSTSLIPVVSLYFNPALAHIFRKLVTSKP